MLEKIGVKVYYADVRQPSDLDQLPRAQWVVDAAANPSVLAGCDGVSSARQVIENNLFGTVNLLEYARKHSCGFTLLSTSRVYSINHLQAVPLTVVDNAFQFDRSGVGQTGVSPAGIDESFSTSAPISIYGGTKLSSEVIALEYAATYKFPVWINRCGVLAGAGQFGRADQGIFSYWINSYLARQPLRYIGFGARGHQLRDCFHPSDLARLVEAQMLSNDTSRPAICNLGGGPANAMSLRQLSLWCAERFGAHEVTAQEQERTFDIPWMVMDSSLAQRSWNFCVSMPLPEILSEIARHAELHPDWLRLSAI
jgi:CDP-paratose 2-epimerase